MPVTGGHLKVTLRYTYLAQKCENVQFYRLTGTAFATATVLGVLEAYWNDIKDTFRSVFPALESVGTIDSILGDEVGGGLGFAEFSTLGAPVATGVMQPEVGKSVASGFPSVFQDVTGKVVNSNVTSQVSRKIGRGA